MQWSKVNFFAVNSQSLVYLDLLPAYGLPFLIAVPSFFTREWSVLFLRDFDMSMSHDNNLDFEDISGTPPKWAPYSMAGTQWVSLGFLFTPINGLIWARGPYFLLLFWGPETVVPTAAPEEEHLPNLDSWKVGATLPETSSTVPLKISPAPKAGNFVKQPGLQYLLSGWSIGWSMEQGFLSTSKQSLAIRCVNLQDPGGFQWNAYAVYFPQTGN